MIINNDEIFESLHKTMNSYHPISDEVWQELKNISKIRTIKKNEYAFNMYDKVNSVTYVYKGLFRTFTLNEKGEEFTKNFFGKQDLWTNACNAYEPSNKFYS